MKTRAVINDIINSFDLALYLYSEEIMTLDYHSPARCFVGKLKSGFLNSCCIETLLTRLPNQFFFQPLSNPISYRFPLSLNLETGTRLAHQLNCDILITHLYPFQPLIITPIVKHLWNITNLLWKPLNSSRLLEYLNPETWTRLQ